MLNSDQSAVYVLDGAPTVRPALQIGNCEIPLAVLEPLARHERCIEAVARLDLAKHDIILMHFVGGGHGFVAAQVVGRDPRIQRPTRAPVHHGLPELQLLLDHFVPHCPQTQFFRDDFGAECPVHIELRRYLVGPIQDKRGDSVGLRGNTVTFQPQRSGLLADATLATGLCALRGNVVGPRERFFPRS